MLDHVDVHPKLKPFGFIAPIHFINYLAF